MSRKRGERAMQGGLMLVFGGLAASQPQSAQGLLIIVAFWGLCRMVKALLTRDPPAKP